MYFHFVLVWFIVKTEIIFGQSIPNNFMKNVLKFYNKYLDSYFSIIFNNLIQNKLNSIKLFLKIDVLYFQLNSLRIQELIISCNEGSYFLIGISKLVIRGTMNKKTIIFIIIFSGYFL